MSRQLTTKARALSGVVVAAVLGGLLVAGPACAATGPTVTGITDGGTVSGTVPVTVSGVGDTTVSVDGGAETPLANPLTQGGHIEFDVTSYDTPSARDPYYTLTVNGTQVVLPTAATGGRIVSGSFPAGTLGADAANDIVFTAAKYTTATAGYNVGDPDRVYPKDFKVVLDDGTIFSDSTYAAGTVINLGYNTDAATNTQLSTSSPTPVDRPSYTFAYTYAAASKYTYNLDTTALSEDDEHDVVFKDANGSTSFTVAADNVLDAPRVDGLEDGQKVADTVAIDIPQSKGEVHVAVDGDDIGSAASQDVLGGKVTFKAYSYEAPAASRTPYYSITVNGTALTMPTTNTGTGATSNKQLETGSFDAGLLHPGTNTVVFTTAGVPGNGQPHEWDNVYPGDFQVVLSDGTTFVDAPTAGVNIPANGIPQIGYSANFVQGYTFTIDVPSPSHKTFAWDTTQLEDGDHTIVFTDDNGTASYDVKIMNDDAVPTLNVTDGQVVSGTAVLSTTSDYGTPRLKVDGTQVPLVGKPLGGSLTFNAGSITGSYGNKVIVNGTEYTLPSSYTGGATGNLSVHVAQSIPAGLLRAGANTVVFKPGLQAEADTVYPNGKVDQVYFDQLKITLDDGYVIQDAGASSEQAVGYKEGAAADPTSRFYSYTWSFDLTADQIAAHTLAEKSDYFWDTTKVAEGDHVVSTEFAGHTVTRTVKVDNVPVATGFSDGAYVAGTTIIGATGDGDLTVKVDDTEIEQSSVFTGGTIQFDAQSYGNIAGSPAYLTVNGHHVDLPQDASEPVNGSGTGGTWTHYVSSFVPSSYLTVGSNDIEFFSVIKDDEEPDKQYVKSFSFVSASGLTVSDPYSATHRVTVGYDQPEPYYTGYAFTLPLAEEPAFVWDTTAGTEGEHTVTVKDSTGLSASTKVNVDNTGPEITIASPTQGATYLGSDILISATATDRGENKVVNLQLDGAQISNNTTVSAEDLTPGSHTVSVTATDGLGTVSTKTVDFVAYSNYADQPTNPTPASGSTDVSTNPTLSVRVTDPAGEAQDVEFLKGYDSDFTTSAGIRAISGSTTDANPGLGVGAELSTADVDALKAPDSSVATTGAPQAYPYQQFEISAPNGSVQIRPEWSGTTSVGDRVVLSVWNHTTNAWQEIDDATAEGTAGGTAPVSLAGEAAGADTVADNKATVMVQVKPGYIARSQDGVTRVAWLTDTQNLAQFDPDTLNAETQWIADHADSDKIAYTMHTGDLINNYTDDAQWVNASAGMKILDDAGEPYGVVSGNHDYESGYKHYTKYFPASRLEDNPWYGGTVSNNIQHYDYISTPEADYMFLYLTWSATEAEWQWVKDEIAAHPNANVVIDTHEQFSDEMRQIGTSPILVGQGKRFMNEIIEPYPNVVAIFSGHKRTSAIWIQRLAGGRIVLQVQGNYQQQNVPGTTGGGGGFMRYVDFDTNTRPDGYDRMTNYTFNVFANDVSYSMDVDKADPGDEHLVNPKTGAQAAWPKNQESQPGFMDGHHAFAYWDDPNHSYPANADGGSCESLTQTASEMGRGEMTEEPCMEAENWIREITLHKITRNFSTDYVKANVYSGDSLGSVENVPSGSVASVDVAGLQPDTSYDWFVKLTDDTGHSTVSDVWSFHTKAAGTAPIASSIATAASDATVFAFEVKDGALYRKSRPDTGAWSSWISFGAPSGVPVESVSATVSDGELWVLVTGSDGSTYKVSRNESTHTWSPWSSVGAPAGVAIASVTTAASDGQLWVLATGADGKVYKRSRNDATNAWSTWSALGTTTVEPGSLATVVADGQLWVMGVGGDGQVAKVTRSEATDVWSAWSTLVTPVGAQIATVATAASDGAVWVVATGSDGKVYKRSRSDDSDSWSGWAALGGMTVAGSLTTTVADGQLWVFGIDAEGDPVKVSRSESADTWSSWGALGSAGIDLTAVRSVTSGGQLWLIGVDAAGQLAKRSRSDASHAWESAWGSLGTPA